MEVALSCLSHHMPVSERLAEALVDGHCEKTLALLWSIIFHFKVTYKIISCGTNMILYITTTMSCSYTSDENDFLYTVQVKLQLNMSELKEEIAVLERQRPHPLSHHFNIRRSSLEPVIFPDPTLSLLLQWCRAVGNIYGVQVRGLWHAPIYPEYIVHSREYTCIQFLPCNACPSVCSLRPLFVDY